MMALQKINDLVQEIITSSESIEDFFEVEVSVLIRKSGGARSDFIRAQSNWMPPSDRDLSSQSDSDNPFQWMQSKSTNS